MPTMNPKFFEIYLGMLLLPSNSLQEDFYTNVVGDPELNLHLSLQLGEGTYQGLL